MELALSDNNELIEPAHGGNGFCPLCGERLIPKRGPIRNAHWAHKGGKDCDPWYHETSWHRNWKENVDKKFREKIIEKNGTKHIS